MGVSCNSPSLGKYDVSPVGGKRILTLDISKNKTGWCVFDGEVIKTGTISLKFGGFSDELLWTFFPKEMELVGAGAVRGKRSVKKDYSVLPMTGWHYRRILEYLIQDVLWSTLEGVNVDAVVVEKTIMGLNYDTTRTLIELGTVPESMVFERRINKGGAVAEFHRPDSSSWKKVLSMVSGYGRGIEHKSQVFEAEKLLEIDVDELSEDEIDAIGLFIWYVESKRAGSAGGTDAKRVAKGKRGGKSAFKIYYSDEPVGESLGGVARGSYLTIVKRVNDGESSYYFDIGIGSSLGVESEGLGLALEATGRYLVFERRK